MEHYLVEYRHLQDRSIDRQQCEHVTVQSGCVCSCVNTTYVYGLKNKEIRLPACQEVHLFADCFCLFIFLFLKCVSILTLFSSDN
jgi:hypothetical protein